MPIDPVAVDAIDTHVHVESDGHGHHSLDDELMAASARYFGAGTNRTPDLAEIADHYRQRRLAAVVFTVDAHTATGHPALSSERIITEAAAHADVLLPFASVDPHDGPDAVALLRDLAAAGARGLKLHPSLQAFLPNDPRHYPLYEAAAELGLPVVVPHRPDRHRRRPARRPWHQAALLGSDAAGRRGRRLPVAHGHPGAPVGAVAGQRHLDGHPQGQRVHRPVRLVAEVLRATAGPRDQRAR